MINVGTHSHIVWRCDFCGNVRIWKTAWGVQPHIYEEGMEFQSAVPNGALAVWDDKPGCFRTRKKEKRYEEVLTGFINAVAH